MWWPSKCRNRIAHLGDDQLFVIEFVAFVQNPRAKEKYGRLKLASLVGFKDASVQCNSSDVCTVTVLVSSITTRGQYGFLMADVCSNQWMATRNAAVDYAKPGSRVGVRPCRHGKLT